jgi:Flp pilus assembly CpaF family ATPase
VHQHVARAIDAVVHLARLPDGTRYVAEVVEVANVAGVEGTGTGTGTGFRVRPLADGDHVVAAARRGRR